jgi:hypothetical protein
MEVSGQIHASAALPPGVEAPVFIEREAGWASEPVWTSRRREKTFSCWESYLGRPAGSPSLHRLSYPDSYNSKIVDKKEILLIASNTDIYCSSDKSWYSLPSIIHFRKFLCRHQCTLQLG